MSAKTHNKKKKKELHPLLQPPHGYIFVWMAFVVAGLVVGVITMQYNGRALPNVSVGNVAVGNMTAPQLKQVVQDESAELKVTFQNGAAAVTVPAKDVGVSVDIDATVKQALLSRRSTDVARNLAFWHDQTVPLVYSNDAGVLKEYIATHFPQVYVDPQDAQLVFNLATNQFDVKPGVPGRGFDIKKFEAALPDLANNPRAVVLPVSTVPIEPLINDKAAAKVQKEVNNKIKLAIQFTHNGSTAYALKPADIANWAHFNPDTSAGSLSIEFDKAIIQQFIAEQVGGKITTLPVDRKVVIDKQSGDQRVVQQGSKGYQLQDADKLADDVVTALNSNKPLAKDVTVVEAPFKTVTVSGYGKWIEVDLTHQRATLYIGNEVVASSLISSGKGATPTEVGTFAIYAKYPMQTMTGTINGEYYYVPNIKWVSYFDGGEALHGTYWHHNFGHPMSHGCVNMTEAAAKVVYDFAPIGTKVVVHY